MKKYNRYNFFKHTFCEFREVAADAVPSRPPHYKSESGSTYYFDDLGVFRYANHWGRAANCRWRLITDNKTQNGYKWGYALWSDFYPNNESEKLFFITVDFEKQEVLYQHKGSLTPNQNLPIIFRSAPETAKRIKLIKEILFTDDWAKYLDLMDIISTRKNVIGELISTDKSLMQIKRERANE